MKKIFFPFVTSLALMACNDATVSQPDTKKEIKQMTFKKADWINNTDVYEVNLRQYTKEGTFNVFAKELPRLKDMGVSTLWFMPITPVAQLKKKGVLGSQYACRDYTAVSPEFGTLDDFKNYFEQTGFKLTTVFGDYNLNAFDINESDRLILVAAK